MPKINVVINEKKNIKNFIKNGVHGIIIGCEGFSNIKPLNLTLDEISVITKDVHEYNGKIYIDMSKIIHNKDLKKLDETLLSLEKSKVDGIIFSDPAISRRVKALNINLDLIVDTPHLITNSYVCDFWHKKGVKRAVLAAELTLDEILDIKKKTKIEVEILVQGLLPMFISIRKLITNYFKHYNLKQEKRDYYLIDSERKVKYPIFEDKEGTHILSSHEMSALSELPEIIDGGIDAIRIDGLKQTDKYLLEVVKIYNLAINDYLKSKDNFYKNLKSYEEKIGSLSSYPINKGFLFKPTLYKVRENARKSK